MRQPPGRLTVSPVKGFLPAALYIAAPARAPDKQRTDTDMGFVRLGVNGNLSTKNSPKAITFSISAIAMDDKNPIGWRRKTGPLCSLKMWLANAGAAAERMPANNPIPKTCLNGFMLLCFVMVDVLYYLNTIIIPKQKSRLIINL